MSRQRNVQQQNDLSLENMLSTAKAIRKSGLPRAVTHFLAEKGIDVASCAVVSVETAGYVLSLEHGVAAFLVTHQHRILEIELELDEGGQNVLQVIEFRDVTDAQNVSRQNRGTGWGWGAIAIEVHRRMSEA